MKKFLKFVFFGLVPPVVVVAALVFFGGMGMYPKEGPLPEEKIIFVENGTSTRGIANLLVTEGVIEPPGQYIFLTAARIRHSNLRAGEYAFPARTSIKQALTLLESGKTFQRQITVPEGLMSFEIVALVNAGETLTGEITEIPAEGSLLPETYSYVRGEDKNKIIGRMKTAMTEAIAELWEKRNPDTLLKSPEEAVILASVVEKETGVPEERPRVAGVFMNRLKTGMPLQTDPTVIYALTQGKKKLERPLLRKDLAFQSPYNTYVVAGLPPTPIANPGRKSLEAVFAPEAHDFIYFVADGTGGHAFAVTHDEHLRNVAKWREIQK